MAVSQSLSVLEVAGSSNAAANTSMVSIVWQSTQSGDSWNGYTKTAKYYISINGGSETEYTVEYTLPKNTTQTILSKVITVTHKDDGSGSVKVRTWMDTGISAGVVEKSKTIDLRVIPRASTITSVTNSSLGGVTLVTWTPLSISFRYKLKFALGDWSYTTEAMHPNVNFGYTYTYSLPLTVANQIPSDKGTMTVTLYTYSDSDAKTQVGSPSSKAFTVTVPDNASTQPTVTMTLAPVHSLASKFASVYVQGKSKVGATLSATGQYGATINTSSYKMSVLGYTDTSSPYQSGYLTRAETVEVTGSATDSRGFTGSTKQSITVIPYSRPKIIPVSGNSVICARCEENGGLSESGTYLKIKAGRDYSKVESGTTQLNSCLLRCRYKTASATNFSDYITLISKTDKSTDYVDVTLGNVVTSLSTSYVVELNVLDDVGESTTLTFVVPTEEVTFSLKYGGGGAAFGKHAEREKALDIAPDWDMYYKGSKIEEKFYNIGQSHANVQAGDDFNNYTTFGVYSVYNPSSLKLVNCPSSVSGTLTVSSSIGRGNNTGAWAYILQRYLTYDGTCEYYRVIHTDGEGAWIFRPWTVRGASEWADLGFSNDVSESLNAIGRCETGECCYRVINGNHVYVAFNCAFTYNNEEIKVNRNQIPSQYRPTNYVYAMCSTAGRSVARIYITPSGDIMINHIQDVGLGSYTTSANIGWIDGYIDYWV